MNIISYLLYFRERKSHIQVIADDTDIFVLLVYYVLKHKAETQISMKMQDRRVIYINKTVASLRVIYINKTVANLRVININKTVTNLGNILLRPTDAFSFWV